MRFVLNYENLETDLTTLSNKIDFEKVLKNLILKLNVIN